MRKVVTTLNQRHAETVIFANMASTENMDAISLLMRMYVPEL
jgi:hypothetical protein